MPESAPWWIALLIANAGGLYLGVREICRSARDFLDERGRRDATERENNLQALAASRDAFVALLKEERDAARAENAQWRDAIRDHTAHSKDMQRGQDALVGKIDKVLALHEGLAKLEGGNGRPADH